MVQPPGLRVQKRVRKNLSTELNLTALVDVLTILLVFALVNFAGAPPLEEL